jgi:hypothetical protein
LVEGYQGSGDGMKNIIQKEFDKFSLLCFGDISKQQYIDLRRTFFAGASAFYLLEISLMSASDEPTEDDMELMRSLHNEIHEFNEAVKKGEK